MLATVDIQGRPKLWVLPVVYRFVVRYQQLRGKGVRNLSW